MNSLESRLHLGLALTLALLMLATLLLGHNALHHMMERFVESRLEHDAEAMLLALHTNRQGQILIRDHRLTPVYSQPLSGHYYVLATKNGEHLISRSLWDQDLNIPLLSPGETKHWHMDGPNDQHLLVLAKGYQKSGVSFTLALAEDVTPIAQILVNYEWLFAFISVGGVLLLIFVQRWVVHRGFRQLQPVYDDMKKLERGQVVALTEAVPQELTALVRKFNELLRLMDQRLERSRNALGNLAHALKTPLALLTQQMESPELDKAPAGIRNDMETQVERIRALMDRELKRARLAGSGGTGHYFEPEQEFPFLIELLERMYANPKRTLQVQSNLAPGLIIEADREDMLELLGNLLENAFKWAERRIKVSSLLHEDSMELIVEDDGPGCSHEQIEELTRRGVRLDEQKEGHGLGLTIAKDIASLYGAQLKLGRSEKLGGFSASISFPRSH
jgi:signal transduction histidine kinase